MLNTRQKCLLYFIKRSKECSKLKLAKVLFLAKEEGGIEKGFKFYSFVPYRFGPYSFEMFNDIDNLEDEKLLIADENMVSYFKGSVELRPDIQKPLNRLFNETRMMNEGELMNYVYNKYPDYTILSEIESKKKYVKDKMGVFTVGYEGLSIDEFLMMLIREKVHVLIDIRKNPWSMKFGFKKYGLRSLCERVGVEYMGFTSLGIPRELRKNLSSKKDYELLFKNYKTVLAEREKELDILSQMAKRKRIALMCFEKDPNYCHRSVLAEELRSRGSRVEIN
ncbi:MAG: DUF488 domain-containing protein [Thermoplasmata archaeon]|nr:MAG: DUF488 domain-containing protein [Thermoplasmata archaeon]